MRNSPFYVHIFLLQNEKLKNLHMRYMKHLLSEHKFWQCDNKFVSLLEKFICTRKICPCNSKINFQNATLGSFDMWVQGGLMVLIKCEIQQHGFMDPYELKQRSEHFLK